MRRTFISGVLVVATAAALAATAPTRYDRATEKAITGTIKAVVSYPAPDGSVGVHFDLKTADAMISVHVAPALYIGQQNFAFFADETVEIIGSRVAHDGRTTFWAKGVMKGSNVLRLRTDEGVPMWPSANDGTDGCGVAHPALPRETEY